MSELTQVYQPRTKQNKAGVVYNPDLPTVGFAEDITKLDDEVIKIEECYGQFPGVSAQYLVQKAVYAGNLASGHNDIYVCPAGKKAYITSNSGHNPSGSSISVYRYLKKDGVYYQVRSVSTMAANANITANASAIPLLLNAGEGISINCSAAGGNYAISVWEMPDTDKLQRKEVLGLASGINIIYTVPAGKRAIIWPAANYSINGDMFIHCSNSTTNVITVKWHVIKNGESGGTATIMKRDSVPSRGEGFFQGAGMLSAGDSIAIEAETYPSAICAYAQLYELDTV